MKSQLFLELSDKKLKTNIVEIVDSLRTIESLHGYTYKWKEGKHKSTVIGFIAQEVNNVAPEVIFHILYCYIYQSKLKIVGKDKNGYFSVSYSSLMPLLIQSLQQLVENQMKFKNNDDNFLVLFNSIKKIKQKFNIQGKIVFYNKKLTKLIYIR